MCDGDPNINFAPHIRLANYSGYLFHAIGQVIHAGGTEIFNQADGHFLFLELKSPRQASSEIEKTVVAMSRIDSRP